MDASCHALLHAPAAFAVDVAVQVLALRAAPRLGLFRSHVAGFGSGLLALAALVAARMHGAGADALALAAADLIAFACLGYCYFHFVNLGATARRIRIMAELADAPAGLTRQELLERYGAREIVARRLDRLLGTGQIALAGGRYRTGRPAMLLAARVTVALKVLVLGQRSERDG